MNCLLSNPTLLIMSSAKNDKIRSNTNPKSDAPAKRLAETVERSNVNDQGDFVEVPHLGTRYHDFANGSSHFEECVLWGPPLSNMLGLTESSHQQSQDTTKDHPQTEQAQELDMDDGSTTPRAHTEKSEPEHIWDPVRCGEGIYPSVKEKDDEEWLEEEFLFDAHSDPPESGLNEKSTLLAGTVGKLFPDRCPMDIECDIDPTVCPDHRGWTFNGVS
jgi:hypothetical protein